MTGAPGSSGPSSRRSPLAVSGRTADAVAAAEAGFADHTTLGDELAIAHPATHLINQVFALTEAGRLTEAEQLARAGAEVVASYRVPIAQIWFAANLGRVTTLQGRIATARRYYAEAAGPAVAARAGAARERARAAADFGALGAMLPAAGAGSGAAEALSRSGDQRGAKAALRRSASLAAACEGAATPGLLRAPAAAQLTAREREIARLAGDGTASKDIAERLGGSVRTVDNHLQHVYAKLGVTSRAELARALENDS